MHQKLAARTGNDTQSCHHRRRSIDRQGDGATVVPLGRHVQPLDCLDPKGAAAPKVARDKVCRRCLASCAAQQSETC
eukprot:2005565-Pleurochrysis_carterae.AAC.1